jgi:hypothetical protein
MRGSLSAATVSSDSATSSDGRPRIRDKQILITTKAKKTRAGTAMPIISVGPITTAKHAGKEKNKYTAEQPPQSFGGLVVKKMKHFRNKIHTAPSASINP